MQCTCIQSGLELGVHLFVISRFSCHLILNSHAIALLCSLPIGPRTHFAFIPLYFLFLRTK